MNKCPVSVVHLMRKPQGGFHSFERLFRDVRSALPADDFNVRVVSAWCHSRGLIGRCLNIIRAFFIRADVVHVTGDIHYVAPALLGRRVILTIHDMAILRAKTGLVRWIFRYLWYTLPIRSADLTTTISTAVCDELHAESGLQSEAVQVVPNCISTEFRYMPKAWSGTPIVLMVGTKHNKNLERMMEALHGLRVEVQVVGKLPECQRQELLEYGIVFRELGRLTDAELIKAYRDCDLLAFASTYEGFGMPVVEAQQIGRPVLASSIPALSEVAGDGAVLVDPHDIGSIRKGFERLLGDSELREGLVERGRSNAQRYSPDVIAGQYAECYRKLVA